MRLGLYNNKRNLRQTHLQRQHSRTHNNHLSIFRGARGVYVRAYMEYGIECNFPAQSLHSAHTLYIHPFLIALTHKMQLQQQRLIFIHLENSVICVRCLQT